MCNGWRFSIVPLQTCLIGILWHPEGYPEFAIIQRIILYYQEMTYFLGLVPLHISEIYFEMEHSISKVLMNPSTSPWAHRFEVRRLGRIIQSFPRATFSKLNPITWQLGRKMKQCCLAPFFLSRMEIIQLWHS